MAKGKFGSKLAMAWSKDDVKGRQSASKQLGGFFEKDNVLPPQQAGWPVFSQQTVKQGLNFFDSSGC
jgi:hypothetical protein